MKASVNRRIQYLPKISFAVSVLLIFSGCAVLDDFLGEDNLGLMVTGLSMGYLASVPASDLTPEMYASVIALNEAAWAGGTGGTGYSMAQGSSQASCEQRAPRCEAANHRAIALQERFSASGGSMVSAASEAYCITLLGIGVNGLCAEEYRSQGRFECASLADQQVEIFRQMQQQITATLDAITVSNVRQACSW